MPAHSVGDRVRSNVDAQGMRRGGLFEVVAVVSGFLGIVTYLVRAEDGRELEVGNGHLLLERVEPA